MASSVHSRTASLFSFYYYFTRGSGGDVLWWARLSVCLYVRISPEPRARSLPIFLCMFSMAVAWSSSLTVTKSQEEGTFWEFSSPLTMHCNVFAAKGIIQSPITSCSRRDHSVAAAFAANRIVREWGDGSAQCGWSIIYDCLVSLVPCLSITKITGASAVDVFPVEMS